MNIKQLEKKISKVQTEYQKKLETLPEYRELTTLHEQHRVLRNQQRISESAKDVAREEKEEFRRQQQWEAQVKTLVADAAKISELSANHVEFVIKIAFDIEANVSAYEQDYQITPEPLKLVSVVGISRPVANKLLEHIGITWDSDQYIDANRTPFDVCDEAVVFTRSPTVVKKLVDKLDKAISEDHSLLPRLQDEFRKLRDARKSDGK